MRLREMSWLSSQGVAMIDYDSLSIRTESSATRRTARTLADPSAPSIKLTPTGSNECEGAGSGVPPRFRQPANSASGLAAAIMAAAVLTSPAARASASTESQGRLRAQQAVRPPNLATDEPLVGFLSVLEGDRQGRRAATPDSLEHARRFLHAAAQVLRFCALLPLQPHVTASVDGDVVLEWWVGSHKLTIYVSAERVDYVKVWGPDVDTEMVDGELKLADLPRLWTWLRQGR